jgi:2-C-methyl-D-erythritol 2,4-cyclodiphosphate synthase
VSALRVGQGFDAHALVPGRALILGGVPIASERGLLGHSDADVLAHAVTDALLGAAALGDIGAMFPDSDERYRGADSMVLLREALAKVHEAGWRVVNADCTVIAQAPRISPYVPQIRASLGAALQVDPAAVSVKGKTTEWLGFTGRGEGIVSLALVTIEAR